MRLLERNDAGGFSVTKDLISNIPVYAILSHTWGDDDQEVTFKDIVDRSGKSKAGYQKISFCGEQAARDGLRYFWIDTCCIDKANAIEVQKSINSMFLWYKNAVKCYVYLSDVSAPDDGVGNEFGVNFESAFRDSRWFTRGWTLQELLAPSSVEFFSVDCKRLGDKLSLERLIHERTGIPVKALQGYDPTNFSIDERESWVAKRETRHEEDMAYSLLGIFGVFLPLIYGEGRENAFRRLREEVNKINQSHEFERLSTCDVESQPRFTVPFDRDPKFVGREGIIQEITNRLETQRRIALCGIGGIGKSQIAIEYCYQWKYRYPGSHIFWVNAVTFDGFELAFRDIAKKLSIPGIEDSQNDTLVIIRDWLSKPENGSWLLVLDNADDLDLFFESNQLTTQQIHPPISNFLPRSTKGFIITTTRDKKIGQRLTDREEEIMITQLASRDAEQLLRSMITRLENESDEDIQILVEILGCIPLAITQAAAFIRENSMTVKTYTEELQASDSDLQDYLDESLPDPRRYPGSENSITKTWKLSFDQIAKHFPRAANLLSLMVQLDRQAIPKALLKQKNDRSIEFNKAVGTLQAYSLIKTEKGGSSFEIHPLVQLSTQRWLSLQHKETEWQEKALELMVENFPSGYYGTWEECESLFLHAKCVTRYNYTYQALLQRAELLENLARYDEKQGRFNAAYTQYKDVLQIRESQLGKTHPATLKIMRDLVLVLNYQGKYAEAEIMGRQTLQLEEEVLGKTHPDTLICMSKLAEVLENYGKYAEAETMALQILKLSEEVLGETHPDTLATMTSLITVLDKQDKYAEAEIIARQTLKLKEKVLGKTHPLTLVTMASLATVLNQQRKYTEAEAIGRQTTKLEEEVLGKSNPNIIGNLAVMLYKQGKPAEAETMGRQALKLKEEVLGKTHSGTLMTMGNLVVLLLSQGKYAEAENVGRQTIKLDEEVFGKIHPETARTMNNLCVVLDEQGKYAEAETLCRQAVKLREEVLGTTHPSTFATISQLAKILQHREEYQEASILYQRACTGFELVLGTNHSTTKSCVNEYSALLDIIKEENQV